jgi:two-component system NarL family sensor kinase
VPEDLVLSEPTEQLLFRCAQEGLRNTHKHATAAAATVTVRDLGSDIVMDVRDDGEGFDPSVLAERPAQGHFGVRALSDLVNDAGGRLEVLTAPGQGTTLRVRLRR